MREVIEVSLEGDQERPARRAGKSLMTPLGVVEGEVLQYLDNHRAATLRRLNREVSAPAYLVMMAVGALIRSGLVRGAQHELEVVVRPRKSLHVLRGAAALSS